MTAALLLLIATAGPAQVDSGAWSSTPSAIRAHAEKSGFPANRITEIHGVIDPSTAVG